jgi:4-alpha-glucanotransferase
MQPSLETVQEMRDRLKKATALPGQAPVEQVIEATYRALADSPARIITATLEDALQVEERPNIPATSHERPNWSLALPGGLEALEASQLARRIAAVLNEREPADTGTDVAPHPPIGNALRGVPRT